MLKQALVNAEYFFMNKPGSKPSNPYYFVLFGLLICAVIYFFENKNHRFNVHDFEVYYSAAKSLTQGEQVYGLSFGLETGFYKYSPFTLLLFVPYTLLSFKVAGTFHFLLLSVCAIGAIMLIYRIVNTYFFPVKPQCGLMFLLFICILNHLFRELHLGNINIILVLLVSLVVFLTLQSKPILAGFLLGLIIITKPYFLLLILPVIVYKNLKLFLATALSIVIFLIAPALFIGFKGNLELHQQWLESMSYHGSYLTSTNTLEYLIQRYIYPVNQGSLQNYLIILFSLVYLLVSWFSNKKSDVLGTPESFREKAFITDMFLLTASIPNLVITDTEHFLLSLPLIALLLCCLQTKKNYKVNIAFAVCIIFYGGTSTELLVRKL